MRRAALPLFALLCGTLSAAEEEVVIRVEARIDGGKVICRCGGRDLTDLDAVEAWLKEQKAKAGNARIRPLLGGTEDAIYKALKDVDERFWRAGLSSPEVEEAVIRVEVREQGGRLLYRCGGRDLTDVTAVTAWLVEQKAKTDAIVRIVLSGPMDPVMRANIALLDPCVAKGLVPTMDIEEDRKPLVTPGDAPPSGKVFRLEISDEGGLGGPDGETSLGDWAKSLKKEAKGIRPDHLVEHEVVLRVGGKTAWGQLQIVLAAVADMGYYRVFVEYPQGGTWPRVTFRLPVAGPLLTQFAGGGGLLLVDASGVRLHHDEGALVMATRVQPSDRGPVVSFGWGGAPMPIDAPEVRTFADGQRGVERRRGHAGITYAFDAPPDLPASAVLRVVGIVNEGAGLVVMTCDATPTVTKEHLGAKKLPIPPPAAPEDPEDDLR